jgi:protein ImuB
MTVAAWAWAEPPKRERVVIESGMSLAEAMGVLALAYGSQACHAAEIDADDPVADKTALEKLARMCRRFSPIVGIETVPTKPGRRASGYQPEAECLHLDVTHTAGFFGGEGSLARTAVWTLAARGLHARTAIADTPAAAWAAAHHTDRIAKAMPMTGGEARRLGAGRHKRYAVVPPGVQRLSRGEEAMLADLPLSALRLEPAAIAMLHEVGVDTIGGVLRFSTKSLASRFPASVSLRLAEFTGSRAEPVELPHASHGDPLPQAAHDFELPMSLASVDEAAMANLLEPLVEQCTTALAARGEGITALQVRLEPSVAASTTATAAPTVIDVSLFRPSRSPRHLVDLVRLRMGRMRLPREIDSITVEVVTTGPVLCRQRPLFDARVDDRLGTTTEDEAIEVGLLLDRLAGRLGRPAVFEPRSVTDAQPEHAWLAAPPKMTAATRRSGSHRFERAGRRPVWMPPRPIPLDTETISVAPDGPPAVFEISGMRHRVAKAHGPERIETAWWRGPTVRRDYYVVETESGSRFWLFKRLGSRPRGARESGWYLHGVFA